MTARLKERYHKEIVPELRQKFGYKNPLQVPRLKAITLNVCTRDAIGNAKVLETIVSELGAITGQKGVMTKARKSIATFKLREGMAIGAKVTLRKDRMWEFLDRLVTLALPRVRDFRGVSTQAFDSRGNYNLGLDEQIIFPEIDYDKIDKIHGLGITISTTAQKDEEGLALLEALGMPFFKKKPKQ